MILNKEWLLKWFLDAGNAQLKYKADLFTREYDNKNKCEKK
jgi:hypothetical protein